ncbi:MAG TPA: tRNA (N6-threonylcarbamoyladenosine(37)-N6)-methyltransferase TrmO [Dehalococcoidia bacterium]|nr:tRNA (N6-threonylcarbamoyladenosine(37)-N6)-methyltransferase TrmO [Dehalococcoidia bacterium]
MVLGTRLKNLLTKLGLLPEELIPTEPVALKPVGVVRNRVREPRMEGWEDLPSDIILRKNLAGALDGIEEYSHIVVLFHLHRVSDEERSRTRCHPRGDPRYPLQGVFATRTQHRPNPVGISVVPLLKRRGNVVRVKGLDAVNGTPVLDIKPHIPLYDAPSEVRLPEWVTQPPLPPS